MFDTEERDSPKALKNIKIDSKSVESLWENVWNETEEKSGRLKKNWQEAACHVSNYGLYTKISNMVIFAIWKYSPAYNLEEKKNGLGK